MQTDKARNVHLLSPCFSIELRRRTAMKKKLWNDGKPPWNKGLKTGPRSNETKLKISKAQKGRPLTEEHVVALKEASYWKGRHRPKETRKKISETMIGRKQTIEHRINNIVAQAKGNKDYCDAWYDKEYKTDLRKAACENCSITNMMNIHLFGERLIPHHVDGDKQNCHPDNFRTLCKRCHSSLHMTLTNNRMRLRFAA
jgi:hypothetical protein